MCCFFDIFYFLGAGNVGTAAAQPGAVGGGAIPTTNVLSTFAAFGLIVPLGLLAVSVFPPFAK